MEPRITPRFVYTRRKRFLVKQFGSCFFSIVFGSFPVKIRREDVLLKLLIVGVQLISVDKDLGGRDGLLQSFY